MMLSWRDSFRDRMRRFRDKNVPGIDGAAYDFLIKIRASSGCFHRDHSPQAYRAIDEYLAGIDKPEFLSIEEHESGPEILVYIAVTAAGIQFAKSVIDLIVAILKARSYGISRGDRPAEPVEIIIRSVTKKGEYIEEILIRIGHHDNIDGEVLKKELERVARKMNMDKGEE